MFCTGPTVLVSCRPVAMEISCFLCVGVLSNSLVDTVSYSIFHQYFCSVGITMTHMFTHALTHKHSLSSLWLCMADVEIMVEPGNLVPSQKPKVAAIFRQNSRIISNLYTYICLQQLVYIYLSAATCIPTSVCSHLYTYICLQQLIYLHLSAATCIPTYV